MFEFKPVTGSDREQLIEALRLNATEGAALRLDPRDTTFRGGAQDTDEDVIALIKSVPCHYSDDRAKRLALEMLQGNDTYIEDARKFAAVGNSVVGSLLSLQHQIPRQYAEQAVLAALRVLDSSNAEYAEPGQGHNYTLTRSGKAPLRFRGELVAESDGERHCGKEQNRWHELALYRTQGGKFVVSIKYRTRWQGELGNDLATVHATAQDAAAALSAYDPSAHVQGFPVGDTYAEKQRRMLDDLRRRYQDQVSDLLSELPDAAEEVE